MTKFTHEDNQRNEAVAFITASDGLMIRDMRGANENLMLTDDGTTLVYDDESCDLMLKSAKKLFFPGDTVTITF